MIGQPLEGQEHGAHLLGNDGLIGELKKRLPERMLNAEMEFILTSASSRTPAIIEMAAHRKP